MIKIHKASTPFEFRTLFDRIANGVYRHPLAFHLKSNCIEASGQRQRVSIATVPTGWKELIPLDKRVDHYTKTKADVCGELKEKSHGAGSLTEALSTKIQRQTTARAHHPSHYRSLHRRKGCPHSGITEVKDDVEWYIKLATEIFEEDIQWHLDQLSELSHHFTESTNDSEALTGHRSEQGGDPAQSNTADCQRLLKSYLNCETDDENNCNIRIDINGIINNRLSNQRESFASDSPRSNEPANRSAKRIPNAAIHMRGNNMNEIETINHEHHSLLSISPQPSEAINVVSDNEQQQQQQHHIDNLIGTLCTLELSAAGRAPPQIVLTDYSAVRAGANESATETLGLVTGISVDSAIIKTAKSFDNQRINGCLTIPNEFHYRSESRPP